MDELVGVIGADVCISLSMSISAESRRGEAVN